MQNMVSEGQTIRFTAAADIASGEIVMVGDVAAVATNSFLNGDTEAVGQTEGVFSYAKDGGAIAQGAVLYLNSGVLSETNSGSDPAIGKAWEAALAGDATAKVKLNV